jgi:DNA-directed RNA polymerase subunit RPC12/RpoP
VEGLIKSSGGKSVTIPLEFRILSLEERRRAAWKGLGINWGLSLAFLPLPPVHWLATPFFFFFGFYWASKKYREEKYLKELNFNCPECNSAVSFKEQPAKNSKEINCPHCRYLLRLTW